MGTRGRFLGAGLALLVGASTALAQAPLGTELNLHTLPDGTQQRPSAAAAADGSFVVAWDVDYHVTTLGPAIEARRYDSSGQPVGSEMLVWAGTLSFVGTGAQVASASDGRFVITWAAPDDDGTGTGVRARRYTSAGSSVGSDFQVWGGTLSLRNPSVAMDSDGDFVVAWVGTDDATGEAEVRGVRYDSTGSQVGADFRAFAGTLNPNTQIDVQMNAAGRFVIVAETQDQDQGGILASGFDATGAPVYGDRAVNTTYAGNQSQPSVGVDSAGNTIVAWSSDHDSNGDYVYGQRLSVTGANRGGEFQLNALTSIGSVLRAPSVGMSPQGSFVVSWNLEIVTWGRLAASSDIMSRSFMADTTAGPEEQVINQLTSIGGDLSVASLGNGAFVAAYAVDNGSAGGSEIDSAARILGTTLSISDASVWEGDSGLSTASLTISGSNWRATSITAPFSTSPDTATAGPDYKVVTGQSATLPAGIGDKVITVQVRGDAIHEGDEQLFVNLGTPTGARLDDSQAALVINDDDPEPLISIGDTTVVEGHTGTVTANYTVTMTTAADVNISVPWATSGGTATGGPDYKVTSGVLTIPAGSRSGVLGVRVRGDLLDEPDETVGVDLQPPSLGGLDDDQGEATIIDDDATPAISVSDLTITEGDSGDQAGNFTVSLSNPSQSTVSVTWQTTAGTATAGPDYRHQAPVAISFAPGTTSRLVTVRVRGDLLSEGPESFTVDLSAPLNATIADGVGTATITDNE